MKAVCTIILVLYFFPVCFGQNMIRDISFNRNNPTADANVRGVATMSDNSIIITGDFLKYDQDFLNGNGMIAHLQSDGTIDAGFHIPLISGPNGGSCIIRTVAIQPWDNKILIGGDFALVDGVFRNHIARLNSDGTLDLSFDPGSGFEDHDQIYSGGDGEGDVYSILVEDNPDPSLRRIYAGGSFETYNGVRTGTLVRVDEWGKLDGSYDPQVNHGAVFSICKDKMNSLVIGGEFWYIGNAFTLRLARLTSGGTNDGTFSHAWINNSVSVVAVDNHNMILAGGKFTSVGSNTCNGIARFQNNGAIDPLFDTGSGLQDGIYTSAYEGTDVTSFYVRQDDVIFVGGNFKTYNGVTCGNIAAINNNGKLNTSINFGSGFNYPIRYIVPQSFGPTDQKFLVGSDNMTLTQKSQYRSERQGNAIRLVPSFDVLPTKLISNKATRYKGEVKIEWETATQSENETIRIKRSLDGIHFTTSGNLTQAQVRQPDETYLFTDKQIPQTDLFYKIQFMSDSSIILESRVMVVKYENDDSQLKVFRSGTSSIQINTKMNNTEPALISVYNMEGKLINKVSVMIEKGSSRRNIHLEEFLSGQPIVISIGLLNTHRIYNYKILM